MKRIAPDSARIERLFRKWHGRDTVVVRYPYSEFPEFELPTRLYPRGGLIRTYYLSDKKTPEGPPGVWESYVHCVFPELGARGVCACGHEEHDELPRSFATVYDDERHHTTEWPEREPLEIAWSQSGAFLGYVKDFDELRSPSGAEEPMVKEVRFSDEGWLVALDERTVAIFRPDGKVYVATGGELRVTGRGLIG